MKICVSGQDRTGDLGEELHLAGQLLRANNPALATPETRLIAWQQTSIQADYESLIRRVLRSGPDHESVAIKRPGSLAAFVLRLHVLARKIQMGWPGGNQPPEVGSEIGVLTLLQARSERDYADRYLHLMKYRDNLDSLPFTMPRKPGFAGAVMARFRILLWQLLRFMVDRIAFRQNHINTMLTRALEFEHAQRTRETEALEKRIAELEARLPAPPPSHGN